MTATDPTVRIARTFRDGHELEAEAQQRGSLIRLRARLWRDGRMTVLSVTAAITDLLLKREFLPKEFYRDPAIAQATMEPVEEIWRGRLRLLRRAS
jgi:hypothetical protein